MNKKMKFGLSFFGLVLGVSAVLSGCAPKVTKTSSSALPPAKQPAVAAVQPSTTAPAKAISNTNEQKYPWLANYKIDANSNNIHFAFDKSILTSIDKMTLKKDAIYLKYNSGVVIQIQGNCDRRGSEAYNLALGWRRANAAKAYLQDLGVAGDRLKTISYGKEKPLCKAHTESCYAKNRRDHFVAAK